MGQDNSVVKEEWIHNEKYEVLKESHSDPNLGDYKIVRFYGIGEKNRFFIIKTIDPTAYEKFKFDPKDMSKRIQHNHSHISSFVTIVGNRLSAGHFDLVFEYSNLTIADVTQNRQVTETEIWQLFEFLTVVGQLFESRSDHFHCLRKRNVLLINGRMKLCNQHIYDPYLLSIIRDLLSSQENPAILKADNHRKNVRYFGMFLLNMACSKGTDIEFKSKDDVLHWIGVARGIYNPNLVDIIECCCLSEHVPGFSEIKQMRRRDSTEQVKNTEVRNSDHRDRHVSPRPSHPTKIFDETEGNMGKSLLMEDSIDLKIVKTNRLPQRQDDDKKKELSLSDRAQRTATEQKNQHPTPFNVTSVYQEPQPINSGRRAAAPGPFYNETSGQLRDDPKVQSSTDPLKEKSALDMKEAKTNSSITKPNQAPKGQKREEESGILPKMVKEA